MVMSTTPSVSEAIGFMLTRGASPDEAPLPMAAAQPIAAAAGFARRYRYGRPKKVK
jgi:hypothetical protein